MADWSPETWLIAAGRNRTAGEPLNVAPVFASNFYLPDERVYSRSDGTPTTDALESLLGGLEGGRALVFASGMAAAAVVFNRLPVGAHIAVPTDPYHGVEGLVDEGEAQGRARHRKKGRPLERPSEGAGEVGVGHRVGRDRVDGSGDLLAAEVQQQPDDVVDVDPGHPLLAVPEAAAGAHLEWCHHLGEGTAVRRQHHADAQTDDPDTVLFGAHRLALPIGTYLGEVAVTHDGALIEYVIFTVAVVTDRRRGDENPGLFLQGRECFDQVARANHPAVADAALLFGAPTLPDRFAGEVEHDIDAVERRGGRRPRFRLPIERFNAELLLRTGGAAAQHPRDSQSLEQGSPDQPRSSRNH